MAENWLPGEGSSPTPTTLTSSTSRTWADKFPDDLAQMSAVYVRWTMQGSWLHIIMLLVAAYKVLSSISLFFEPIFIGCGATSTNCASSCATIEQNCTTFFRPSFECATISEGESKQSASTRKNKCFFFSCSIC